METDPMREELDVCCHILEAGCAAEGNYERATGDPSHCALQIHPAKTHTSVSLH